jgi:hypothetical protein
MLPLIFFTFSSCITLTLIYRSSLWLSFYLFIINKNDGCPCLIFTSSDIHHTFRVSVWHLYPPDSHLFFIHRHPSICIPFDSHFIYYNKHKIIQNINTLHHKNHQKQQHTCCFVEDKTYIWRSVWWKTKGEPGLNTKVEESTLLELGCSGNWNT